MTIGGWLYKQLWTEELGDIQSHDTETARQHYKTA